MDVIPVILFLATNFPNDIKRTVRKNYDIGTVVADSRQMFELQSWNFGCLKNVPAPTNQG